MIKLTDKYAKQLGKFVIDTYGLDQNNPLMVGKLIEHCYSMLVQEEMRDLREKANKAQYDSK